MREVLGMSTDTSPPTARALGGLIRANIYQGQSCSGVIRADGRSRDGCRTDECSPESDGSVA